MLPDMFERLKFGCYELSFFLCIDAVVVSYKSGKVCWRMRGTREHDNPHGILSPRELTGQFTVMFKTLLGQKCGISRTIWLHLHTVRSPGSSVG